MTVSIVIAAYNGATTLDEQLTAVTRSCRDGDEVIVVDNGSTDATVLIAESFPGVRLLRCATRGRCAARNAGVGAAKSNKILICDQDDAVSSGWVDTMSRALDEFDVVGGPLEQDSLNDPLIRRTRKNQFATSLPKRDGVSQPTAANMGFRRSVFDAIGGFDEAFLIGNEDNDFTYRASESGFSVGFAPGALVRYRLRPGRRESAHQSAQYALSELQFRAKHHVVQPWKSQVLRALHHLWRVARVWTCVTKVGRFLYSQDLAVARVAWTGYRRYGMVA